MDYSLYMETGSVSPNSVLLMQNVSSNREVFIKALDSKVYRRTAYKIRNGGTTCATNLNKVIIFGYPSMICRLETPLDIISALKGKELQECF